MSAFQWTLSDGVGRLTLDHPPVNLLTRAVLAECRERLQAVAGDPDLRVLILDANGRHFSAGADVGEHMPGQWESLIPEFLETIAQLDAFPLPVVAAVQGRCLGGGFEFVLPADVLVAADDAAFGQPEIVLGVTPPAACALLPDRVSPGAAAAIVYSGDPVTAEEAHRLGLVWHVVPAADLAATARALAMRMARHSAAALRAAKEALKGPRLADRRQRLDAAGAHYAAAVMTTRDAVEGLTAFLEKRAPAWSHT